MSETLLGSPEAQPTPDGQGATQTVIGSEPVAETPAEPTAAEPTADPAPEAAAEPPAEGAEAEKPEPQAPEAYEFKLPEGLPEGHSVDEQMLDAWGDIARELDLTQESAQTVVDKFIPAMIERAVKQQESMLQQWEKDAREHPDVTAGEGLEANLRAAEQAISKFGSDGLRELLVQGIGNHPEVVAFFVKVGNALKPDGFVSGESPAGKSPPNPNDSQAMAELLYGKS